MPATIKDSKQSHLCYTQGENYRGLPEEVQSLEDRESAWAVPHCLELSAAHLAAAMEGLRQAGVSENNLNSALRHVTSRLEEIKRQAEMDENGNCAVNCKTDSATCSSDLNGNIERNSWPRANLNVNNTVTSSRDLIQKDTLKLTKPLLNTSQIADTESTSSWGEAIQQQCLSQSPDPPRTPPPTPVLPQPYTAPPSQPANMRGPSFYPPPPPGYRPQSLAALMERIQQTSRASQPSDGRGDTVDGADIPIQDNEMMQLAYHPRPPPPPPCGPGMDPRWRFDHLHRHAYRPDRLRWMQPLPTTQPPPPPPPPSELPPRGHHNNPSGVNIPPGKDNLSTASMNTRSPMETQMPRFGMGYGTRQPLCRPRASLESYTPTLAPTQHSNLYEHLYNQPSPRLAMHYSSQDYRYGPSSTGITSAQSNTASSVNVNFKKNPSPSARPTVDVEMKQRNASKLKLVDYNASDESSTSDEIEPFDIDSIDRPCVGRKSQPALSPQQVIKKFKVIPSGNESEQVSEASTGYRGQTFSRNFPMKLKHKTLKSFSASDSLGYSSDKPKPTPKPVNSWNSNLSEEKRVKGDVQRTKPKMTLAEMVAGPRKSGSSHSIEWADGSGEEAGGAEGVSSGLMLPPQHNSPFWATCAPPTNSALTGIV